MTTLILAGTTILAAAYTVTDLGDRYATADAHYPKHLVTDLAQVDDAPAGCGPGWTYVDGAFTAPEPPPSGPATLDELRAERNRRLDESDRLSGALWADRWEALTPEARAAWAAYRQALRDLPQIYATDPAAVVWPVPPQ